MIRHIVRKPNSTFSAVSGMFLGLLLNSLFGLWGVFIAASILILLGIWIDANLIESSLEDRYELEEKEKWRS